MTGDADRRPFTPSWLMTCMGQHFALAMFVSSNALERTQCIEEPQSFFIFGDEETLAK